MLRGYQEAVKLPIDFVVRVDADGEYPLYPINKIIVNLEKSPNAVGAFIELKRSRESNGLVDALFHNTMGYIEGLVILGKPMCQHSPGLQIYRKDTLVSILPRLERFVSKHQQKWGLDLAVIKLASLEGEIISIKIDTHFWKERRPLGKVLSQAISATSTLININNKDFL